MQVVEVIPYRTFRERIILIKSYIGKAHIEVCEGYLYIEKIKRDIDSI